MLQTAAPGRRCPEGAAPKVPGDPGDGYPQLGYTPFTSFPMLLLKYFNALLE
jgi:hypothetical protein